MAQHRFYLAPLLDNQFNSIVLGDLNAHSRRWGPSDKPATRSGQDLASQFDEINDYSCINHQEATHEKGSSLDLPILHTDLAAASDWAIHDSLQ